MQSDFVYISTSKTGRAMFLMAFHWRADDGPTLNAGWVAWCPRMKRCAYSLLWR